MPGSDWLVQVPLSELVALKGFSEHLVKLETDNKQLRREIEALRNMQSEIMQLVGDIRREVRKGKTI